MSDIPNKWPVRYFENFDNSDRTIHARGGFISNKVEKMAVIQLKMRLFLSLSHSHVLRELHTVLKIHPYTDFIKDKA